MPRKAFVLVVWSVVLAVCGVIVSNTRFSSDLSAFLPRSPTPAQQALVEQLKDGVVSRLVLVGLRGAPPDRLAAINKSMAAALRQDARFVAVSNGEPASQDADREFIFRYRYLLSTHIAPGYFDAPRLQSALEEALTLMTSEAGMLAKPLVIADPTGEVMRMAEELAGTTSPKTHQGTWISKDQSYSLMLLQTRAAGFDMNAQEQAIAAIHLAFTKAGGNAAIHLDLVGPGVFSVMTRAVIKGDAERFALAAAAIVALMLLIVFRSPRLLVLGFLPVGSGVLAGVAAVALFHGEVHGITLGFGATLIGEAVDYAIYLFLQSQARTGERLSLRRLWPTLRLGVLTSIFGFSALFFSKFPGLAQLGLFSIAGLIAAVLVTRFVLPELLPPGFRVTGIDRFGGYLFSGLRRLRVLRPYLAIAVGIGIASVLARADHLWQDELSSLSPVPLDAQALDGRLRGELGAPDVRHLVVVSAADEQSGLELTETVTARLELIKQQNLIAGYDSPTRYLPSLKAQRTRQASLPASAQLQVNLARAAEQMSFAPEAFAPFIEQVEQARHLPAMTRATLQGTQLALRYDSLVLQRQGQWFAMLPLTQVNELAKLSNALSPVLGEQVALLDLKHETDTLYRDYRKEAVLLSVLGAAAIVLLLAMSLRSVRRALSVCAPIAMAIVLTMAALIWSHQSLTIFHLVGMLLVVAVGSNYALFFERGLNADGNAPRTSVSLLTANLSTMVGFGLLGFSQVPVLSAIGTVVGLGAILSLVCSAALSSEFSREHA